MVRSELPPSNYLCVNIQYTDPVKKKYFKIEKTQTAPASVAWSKDAVKRRRIEDKAQKVAQHRAHLIRNHIKRHFVANDAVTSALLTREINLPYAAERGRGRLEDGDLGAAAWASGLVAKGDIPFAPSFARQRYANMPCFYVAGEDEKTGLGVAYASKFRGGYTMRFDEMADLMSSFG
jgi:hypothetical protein